MVKAGTKFEELAKEIFDYLSKNETLTSVEGPKVFLDGEDGLREFDVVLRSQTAGIKLTTVIECRDYNKKLDVTHVDGFQSKIEDVQANKGILISRRGFSKKAVKKAKRKGISLLVASSSALMDVEQEVSQIGYNLPITVAVILGIEIESTGDIQTDKPGAFSKDFFYNINGDTKEAMIRKSISSSSFDPSKLGVVQTVHPYGEDNKITIGDSESNLLQVNNFAVLLKVTMAKYYFGYLNELPNSKSVIDVLEKKQTDIISVIDILDASFNEIFRAFDHPNLIPDVSPNQLKMMAIPEFQFNINSANLEKID